MTDEQRTLTAVRAAIIHFSFSDRTIREAAGWDELIAIAEGVQPLHGVQIIQYEQQLHWLKMGAIFLPDSAVTECQTRQALLDKLR